MVMQLTPKQSIHLPRIATVARVDTLSNREKVFEFRFDDGKELGQKPGQFVELSIFGVGEAPISVTSSPTQKGYFELAVRATGGVTNKLHTLEKGAKVGIRGPFGNGFPIETLKGKDILFVAGGIGLFPLRSLINYVLDNRKDFGEVTTLFGCRSPLERLFIGQLEEWNTCKDMSFLETVDTCQDDSWKGNVGVITTLFPKVHFNPVKTYAIVVGPPIMYRFVIAECIKKGLADDHIIMSLERRMKCGVGKCGHCQINGLYVCQEGPVFTYAQVKSLKEAV
ncbi:MAG: FAD/NAD(P)-binding protein [Dehalococcoidia bacterium]|jgi:sulfite reductase subunit B|nr:FAD/NAD(P)-binding protein [Dehalococcoidia bacterium]MDD5494917.1 FAD/NAD(P)-binding protein [Dehalococcoidia bacterium]